MSKTLKNLKATTTADDVLSVGYRLPGGSNEQFRETLTKLKENIESYLSAPDYDLGKEMVLKAFEVAFWEYDRGGTKFHPSEISKGDYCLRKLYYDLTGVEGAGGRNIEPKLQRLFDLGTMVHLYIQWNLLREGVMTDFEVPAKSKLLNLGGRIDGEDEEMVFEIKTMNSFQFQRLQKALPEHINQASLYAFTRGKSLIKFIYYSKDTSDMKTFVEPVNMEFLETFRGVVTELKALEKSNKTSTVPTYPERACPNRIDKRALQCPHANTCFK